MEITFKQKGDFDKTLSFLQKAKEANKLKHLDKYGQMGVTELERYTPVRTGTTASSWYYDIERGDGVVSLNFNNSNTNHGVNIAMLLQYGHATGTGGWVEGTDYINPALEPVVDKLVDDTWEEIIKK